MSNKTPIDDPYAAREAQKYDNPIPSREVILQVLEQSLGPMRLEAMCDYLQLNDEDAREAMRRRLIAMERDGQLISNRKREYGRVDKMDLIRGRVQGHRDGFGFVVPSDGSDDLYLPNRQMRKVFDGDEVLARAGEVSFRGNREGAIVDVLTRNTHQVVGRYMSDSGAFRVRPDNPRLGHDVLIPPGKNSGAVNGQFVVVDIIQQPDRRSQPVGQVVEVLGDHLAPGMEIDVAIRSAGIPHVWPEDVREQAQGFGVEVAEADKLNRIDLRGMPFVTIDGEDARDFDDAVFCESKSSGGWRLYVAIADVSHYVSVDSPLDREAIERGNSVYFPDFVVPMLPEALSNGLCSLNPLVDRLCMVCEMTVSAAGRISGYHFYEAVMHSKARLTYNQVGQVINERSRTRSVMRKQLGELVPHLDELHNLYQVLLDARRLRGAIEFETTETRILFDESRKISQIVPVVRNDAHKLIEECMLAANVCAAKFLEKHDVPALYRVHASPKAEKLEKLTQFLGELGLGFTGTGDMTPARYQSVLQQIEGRPDAHLIQTVMLRSMNQAVYSPENLGHFGLAYTAYAHFTSPIRRYPDLLVHRAIRSKVRADIVVKNTRRHPQAQPLAKATLYPYSAGDMASFGEQCSMTERRADEATRDVVSWLKCEYLRAHVGKTFDGVVSAVVGFGLFVELKDLYVEGLVHVTSLPSDYYHFDGAHHRMVGERTRQVYRLGDQVSVQVMRVSLDDRKIDFELAGIKRRRKKASAKTATPVSDAAVDATVLPASKSRIKTASNKSRLGANAQAEPLPVVTSKRRPRKRPLAGAVTAQAAAEIQPEHDAKDKPSRAKKNSRAKTSLSDKVNKAGKGKAKTKTKTKTKSMSAVADTDKDLGKYAKKVNKALSATKNGKNKKTKKQKTKKRRVQTHRNESE